MRKIVVFICIAMLVGMFLISCNLNRNPTADSGTGTTPETTGRYEETTTGQSSGDQPDKNNNKEYTMIIPKYATGEPVIAKAIFDEASGADPSGQKDCTKALQRLVSNCAIGGGGTVWIPAGQYLITGTVRIPHGVVVQGDWNAPDQAKGEYGTVILAKPEMVSSSATRDQGALFELASNSGLIGLTIWYPEQDSANVKRYGFTVYFHDDTYNFTNTLRNLTLLNSYRGISSGALYDEERHGTQQIENIYMCALETGMEMHGGMDTGYTTGIHISPAYWMNAGAVYAGKAGSVAKYCKENATGMILGDLDADMFADVRISGCKTGIRFANLTTRRNSAFWGCLYDLEIQNCVIGIDAEQISSGNSALISNGVVEGSEYAIRNRSKRIPLRLCGVRLAGKTDGNVLTDDTYIPSDFIWSDYTAGEHHQPAPHLYVVENASKYDSRRTDFATEIQKALDKAAETGGIVYIPAGIYSLYTQVTIPEGVELRGSTPILQRDTKWRTVTGTVLLSYIGDKPTAILKKNAGIVGVRFWSLTTSAQQALNILTANPNSPLMNIACVKGEGSGVYITDTMIISAFVGVDFTGCDNHVVNRILGETYRSLVIAGGKNGYIGQCHANAFASDNNISVYFDSVYCKASEWGGDSAKVSPDLLQRVYRIPYQLINAENETVVNVCNYAAYELFRIEHSSANLINVGIDTLKGQNSMFEIADSRVRAVNAMRLFGTSITIDDRSDVVILNRNDRLNISEAPYNSSLSRTDNGTRRFEGEDVKKVLLDCDSVPDGVSGPITVVHGESQVKAGTGAWQITPGDDTIFSYRLSAALDISDYAYRSGYLHLWIYVEDMTDITASSLVQLEMTSAGSNDYQEINWNINRYITQNGWNEIYLPLDTANITPGQVGDSRRGDFNAEKFNYMRLYVGGIAGKTILLDDIYLCMNKN